MPKDEKSQRRFMAPDDPTAVYPIGAGKKPIDSLEDLDDDTQEEPSPAPVLNNDGFNPLVALAILGGFILMAVIFLAVVAVVLMLQ